MESSVDYADASEYLIEPLSVDISSDIELLRSMAGTVEAGLKLCEDPKVQALADTLLKVIAEADRDTSLRTAALKTDPGQNASRDRDDRRY